MQCVPVMLYIYIYIHDPSNTSYMYNAIYNGHYYRQALTEVSVLSDVLHMLQTHRQYITTDPVYVPKGPAVPIALQYNMKKKVTM